MCQAEISFLIKILYILYISRYIEIYKKIKTSGTWHILNQLENDMFLRKGSSKMENEPLISESDYNYLGLNIIKLREIYGESQKDLAEAIGVTKSAISNYEHGNRFPERDDLRAIAKHYNLTVQMLLSSDFSKVSIKRDVSLDDANTIKTLTEKMFPFMCSDEALDNESFRRAHDFHLEFLKSIYNDDDDCENFMMDRCINLYKQAGEDGIPEACANVLGLLLLRLRELMFADKTKEFHAKDLLKKNFVFGSFKYKFLPSVKDRKDPQLSEYTQNIIKDIRTDYFQNIYNLKSMDDSEFNALGDYYIALAYLYNVVGNGLTWAENRQIASEMIGLGYALHNKYAVDLYTSFNMNKKSKQKIKYRKLMGVTK